MAEETMEMPDGMAVEACLDKIRPYIQHDGGDIELLGIDEHAYVYVAFRGACAGCMMLDATLKDGVEQILIEEVPGVLEVQAI